MSVGVTGAAKTETGVRTEEKGSRANPTGAGREGKRGPKENGS